MKKRPPIPPLSPSGLEALEMYATRLREHEDLDPKSVRIYLSDLRHFAAWCEASWEDGQDEAIPFTPTMITTPLLTRYRAYLQTVLQLAPATINRSVVSLKRYCAWATDAGVLQRNPAKVVKLVQQETSAPRHLTDYEEEALLAAVTRFGSIQDHTLLLVLLHTGLRAAEICRLKHTHIKRGKRSGYLHVWGKRNKYREVPLNRTARQALETYCQQLPAERSEYLFPSEKTGGALTERALGYIIKKYVRLAKVEDLSPHDVRHRFGYRMAELVPLHRLAQIMGHNSLDTTMIYVQPTQQDLQREVEKIAWA